MYHMCVIIAGAVPAWEATWKPLHPEIDWPQGRAGHHGRDHALVLPGREDRRRHALKGQAALLQGGCQDDCIVRLRPILAHLQVLVPLSWYMCRRQHALHEVSCVSSVIRLDCSARHGAHPTSQTGMCMWETCNPADWAWRRFQSRRG